MFKIENLTIEGVLSVLEKDPPLLVRTAGPLAEIRAQIENRSTFFDGFLNFIKQNGGLGSVISCSPGVPISSFSVPEDSLGGDTKAAKKYRKEVDKARKKSKDPFAGITFVSLISSHKAALQNAFNMLSDAEHPTSCVFALTKSNDRLIEYLFFAANINQKITKELLKSMSDAYATEFNDRLSSSRNADFKDHASLDITHYFGDEDHA